MNPIESGKELTFLINRRTSSANSSTAMFAGELSPRGPSEQERPMPLTFDAGKGRAGNVRRELATPLLGKDRSESPNMTCAGLSHEAKLFQAASCRTAFPASGSANGSIHGHLNAPATASGPSNGARTADGNRKNL
jgi:hypothetical protein